MISEKQKTKISKFMSLVLRHKPERIGLELDASGWADVENFITKMNRNGEKIDFRTLQHVVDTNSKKRFAFNEDRTKIRANQGHSIEIDHGYKPVTPPEILYHGTGEKSVESILNTGIEKRGRHHVHLSADKDTAFNVGQRHGRPVIIEVMAQEMSRNGFEFYLSENKVWLTDHIPVQYIKYNNQ